MGTNCNATSCQKGVENDIEAAKKDRLRNKKAQKDKMSNLNESDASQSDKLNHDISPQK